MTHILVTGSRHAAAPAHHQAIADALHTVGAGHHTLWHGDAPGADRAAAHIAARLGWHIQPIPADWYGPCTDMCPPRHRRTRHGGGSKTYCPAAGNYRNAKLVAAVLPHLPDVRGFAFPLPGSRGTWDCVQRARAAGLPIDIVRLPVTEVTS